jgi:hypothetical protein
LPAADEALRLFNRRCVCVGLEITDPEQKAAIAIAVASDVTFSDAEVPLAILVAVVPNEPTPV